MKPRNAVKVVGTLALVLAAVVSLQAAGNPNPRVLPINSSPYGHPYGVWSGAWWQWAYSFTAENNPVMDTTGEFAALGQSGPMWFLAGSFGQTITRTVTIPPGKGLFFPIANTVWINLPEWGDLPWSDPQAEVVARDYVTGWMSAFPPQNLKCQIDGVEVKEVASYCCITPHGAEYMMAMPEGNLWGLPPGTYGPCIDGGWYIMLTPLTPGQHTVRIYAGEPEGWHVDVTYNLTFKK